MAAGAGACSHPFGTAPGAETSPAQKHEADSKRHLVTPAGETDQNRELQHNRKEAV